MVEKPGLIQDRGMKKHTHFLTLLILSFSLVSCQKKKEEKAEDTKVDNGSQILPTTTTTTTLPIVTSTTTTTVPVVTTSSTTTTQPAPTTTSTTSTSSTTTSTTLPPAADVLKDIPEIVGPEVDKHYGSDQLTLPRGSGFIHRTDQCEKSLMDKPTFADRISFYTYLNMTSRVPKLGYIASIYELPEANKTLPTSLISHEMCALSVNSLKQTMGDKFTPDEKVVAQANELVKKYNQLRAEMIKSNNSKASTREMTKLWSRMNMCLGYVVSLNSPDQSSSEKVASIYAPLDYRRPAGVLFHERSAGSGVDPERLIIGAFQFTPVASGNIQGCLQQWNALYPACQVSLKSDSAELIRALGSSYQTVNSLCGTEKPVEMFSVQVNTLSGRRTHPDNILASGDLKDPQNRCVSLFFAAGTAYNHFGPLQNSTGKNMEEFLNCTLAQ